MSSNYSANQYDGAYKPSTMRNWQTGWAQLRADATAKRPNFQTGVTIPFCDLNGRFVDTKYRGPTATAYPSFVSTWNLPRRLDVHPNMLNATARKDGAAAELKTAYQQGMQALHPSLAERMRQNTQIVQRTGKKA
ncbi:protein Flattop-like isoform X2 [Paramacrobiotus metropolitanus]|uniref:protein Flattop-like isoform X2 n=1 Tax=Paramacrobiotus metropolitanus TaxID=2943436 RepID=UPI0024463228|nr:protein Flattop-like isoform X2 [Paramacrobiotus metropolitanus]